MAFSSGYELSQALYVSGQSQLIQGNCQDFVAFSGVQVFFYLAPCSTFSASLPFHGDPGANSTGHIAMICEP